MITGTGRYGTTFLVELLTHLGLDTGYTPEELATKKFKEARAGLEYDIRKTGCPYVVKSPTFCDHAPEVIYDNNIAIEHVFVPIRDLRAAAESRRLVVKENVDKLSTAQRISHWFKPKKFKGGMWHTRSTSAGTQEGILLNQLYKLMLAMADTHIPVTLMRYPRTVKDPAYLYACLKPILQDISYETFLVTFNKTVQPELVHRFNQQDQ
jgi:hypothetical protein